MTNPLEEKEALVNETNQLGPDSKKTSLRSYMKPRSEVGPVRYPRSG
jgi:hypothetical protein